MTRSNSPQKAVKKLVDKKKAVTKNIKKAVTKQAQEPARTRPKRKCSSGNNSSTSAASNIARSPGAEKVQSKGSKKRVYSSSEASVESLVADARSTPALPFRTWPVDYWFWMLSAAIPIEVPGRDRILETFDAIYTDHSVLPPKKEDSPWTDPFYDFLWVACEVLIPYEPFGGPGSSSPLQFLGQSLSRNKLIATIMRFAMGLAPHWEEDKWDCKRVSSHMQVCCKKLLTTYNNERLPDDKRHKAGLAIKHLSQGYPFLDFFHSYVAKSTSSPAKVRQRINEAVLDTTLKPADYTAPLHKDKGNLVVHPLIAWLLNRNDYHLDAAKHNRFFNCAGPLAPAQMSPARMLVGRIWWDEFVVRNHSETMQFVDNWWHANRGTKDAKLEFAKAAAERRRPLLDDIFDLGGRASK